MKTVTVLKEELKEIVKRNRDNHSAAYKKAFAGYRQECIEILESNLKALQETTGHVVKFTEYPPEDHTKEYNRILEMLEMSVDSKIELTNQEFQNYVQDDWNWKEQWAASNFKYSNKG